MKKSILILALLTLLVSACASNRTRTPRGTQPALAAVAATATLIPVTATAILPTGTDEPSATPALTATAAGTLFPVVTFAEQAVCRFGPDPNYHRVVTFEQGATSRAEGRSEDNAWVLMLSLQDPNSVSTCWAPVASLEYFGNISDLMLAPTPLLPDGPTRVVTSKPVCGSHGGDAITISWSPVVDGVGYYVYRNGKNIATVYGDRYIDHDTPGSKKPYVYTYTIQAVDGAGLSKLTVSTSITLCG